MLSSILSSIILVLSASAHADCSRQQASDSTVDKGTSVVYTLDEAEAQYNEIYNSGKRIINRVYFDQKSQSYVLDQKEKTLPIPHRFIESLTRQMETALERGYADFLFYSDMGHAHLYMPDSGDTTTENLAHHLEQAELTFLYHTAELFVLRENFKGELTRDPWLQWRYYSRNFVAQNDVSDNLTVLFAKDASYNTVRDLQDHTSVSTVYMSASRNGCFPLQYKGETIYFDLTLN